MQLETLGAYDGDIESGEFSAVDSDDGDTAVKDPPKAGNNGYDGSLENDDVNSYSGNDVDKDYTVDASDDHYDTDDDDEHQTKNSEKADSVEKRTTTSQGAMKLLKYFSEWLHAPDGGRKDKKTAKQHVAQIQKIISVVDPDEENLESLFDVKLIMDTFLTYANKKYHATTIKSYLMSLQHFCSFVISEEPRQLVVKKEFLLSIKETLQRWSASYSRQQAKRRWEKMEDDIDSLIAPEKIQQFERIEQSIKRCHNSTWKSFRWKAHNFQSG